MKSLIEFIYKNIWMPSEKCIYEMATIGRPILNKTKYLIAIHGVNSGDRAYPHIHIYLADDKFPYNKFNFEISLINILCYDEIILIRMRDKKLGKYINNKSKCSWDGYTKLKNDFENWLYEKSKFPGDFIDNLDVIIWNYNNESEYAKENNALLYYIKEHGMKVLNKYKKYFNIEDINNYKECFEDE